MKQSSIFMTGNWQDLIMSTFEVDKKILEPYLPNNTELDLFNGKALMSMALTAYTAGKTVTLGGEGVCNHYTGTEDLRYLRLK